MQLNKHDKDYKFALSLIRERNTVYDKMRRVSPIKLDKPIQHGYVRDLVFENDVYRRADFRQIKSAVEFCGIKKMYHKNKDFITKRKTGDVEQHAYIKSISDPRFKFFWTQDAQLKECEKIEEHIKYLSHCRTWWLCDCRSISTLEKTPKDFKLHYSFKFPWMLREVTNPHFLTHYTPVDIELESQLARINNTLQNKNYYPLLYGNKLYGSYDKSPKSDTSSKYDNEGNLLHSLDYDVEYDLSGD